MIKRYLQPRGTGCLSPPGVNPIHTGLPFSTDTYGLAILSLANFSKWDPRLFFTNSKKHKGLGRKGLEALCMEVSRGQSDGTPWPSLLWFPDLLPFFHLSRVSAKDSESGGASALFGVLATVLTLIPSVKSAFPPP